MRSREKNNEEDTRKFKSSLPLHFPRTEKRHLKIKGHSICKVRSMSLNKIEVNFSLENYRTESTHNKKHIPQFLVYGRQKKNNSWAHASHNQITSIQLHTRISIYRTRITSTMRLCTHISKQSRARRYLYVPSSSSLTLSSSSSSPSHYRILLWIWRTSSNVRKRTHTLIFASKKQLE